MLAQMTKAASSFGTLVWLESSTCCCLGTMGQQMQKDLSVEVSGMPFDVGSQLSPPAYLATYAVAFYVTSCVASGVVSSVACSVASSVVASVAGASGVSSAAIGLSSWAFPGGSSTSSFAVSAEVSFAVNLGKYSGVSQAS